MGGINLFGMAPGQLDELQRLRRQKQEQEFLASRTQGLTPARARAFNIGYRAAGGVGDYLGITPEQKEDPDIAQARQMQVATQKVMSSPEFQNQDPFQQRIMLAREAAQTATRLGNPALASQLLGQITSAMKEQAAYIASTQPSGAKTPAKISEIQQAARALGLGEDNPLVQQAYTRVLSGDKAQNAVDQKSAFAQRVYGLSPDEAEAYALGFIKVETDPQSNRLLITDMLRGETTERKFGPRQQRAFEGAVNTGEAAAAQGSPDVILPQTEAILGDERPIIDVLSGAEITGPGAGVARIAEKTGDIVSTVFGGQPQNIPTIAADQAFILWRKDLIDSLRTSARNAVTEIPIIERQIRVEPGIWKGKAEFSGELNNIGNYLASKYKEYNNFANDQGNPQSARDQDRKSAEAILVSLTKLLGPERTNKLLGIGGQGKTIEVDY